MKIVAMTILCIIFFVQFCVSIGAVVKRRLGCMETLVILVFFIFLYSLLFIVSCS